MFLVKSFAIFAIICYFWGRFSSLTFLLKLDLKEKAMGWFGPGDGGEADNDSSDNGTSTDSSGSYDNDSATGSWSNDSYDSNTASEQGNDGRDE